MMGDVERWRQLIHELAMTVNYASEIDIFLSLPHLTAGDIHIFRPEFKPILEDIKALRLIPFQRHVKSWLHSPDGPMGVKTVERLYEQVYIEKSI